MTEDDPPILMVTADLAALFNRARGTIRRWACEDRWTPYGTRRHRLWLLSQAQDSRSRRGGS